MSVNFCLHRYSCQSCCCPGFPSFGTGPGARVPMKSSCMPAKHFSYDQMLREATLVPEAWGMSPTLAATTARLMCESDLLGVDSHGISMLATYENKLKSGS